MLFPEILSDIQKTVRPEIDKLFQLAKKNSAHPSDLLIWRINGNHEPIVVGKKLNPHTIGQGIEGISENTHYRFIHSYRTTMEIHHLSYAKYLDLTKYLEGDKEHNQKREELLETEEGVIQFEMLVYLKIWEADLFIKRLYQLVRLLKGETYDWYFKLCKFRGEPKGCTGMRSTLLKSIIEDFEQYSKVLSDFIKDTYITQLRNSIAHSTYSIMGDSIQLNNSDARNTLTNLSFKEWRMVIHRTMVLYNELIRLNHLIHDHFKPLTERNKNSINILVTEKNGKQYELEIAYHELRKDWVYKANLSK